MTKSRVVICQPSTFPLRRIAHCPTCERKRRFAGLDAPYYGVTWTCCGCGDSWTDGQRHARPFRRGWRKEAKTDAKATWAAAQGLTPEDHWHWLRREIGDV